jgi:glycosyltransferase involved in cell wall biosynthesis
MIDKILFLSPFFHPEAISTGRYNGYLARALVEAGFHLDVLTSHPLYPDWKPKASKATMAGATIYRGGLSIRYPASAVLRRIVLELWFACHVVWSLLLRRKRYEVAVMVFPPVCFALLSRRLFGAKKVVGIVHDLLGVMATTQSGFVRRLIAKVVRFAEGKAFQSCDRLICVSQAMKEIVIRDYGIPAGNLIVRYPFPTLGDASAGDSLKSLFDSDFIHVVYSGALGEKQRPKDLVDLFKAVCAANPRVACHIFSRGSSFEALQRGAGGAANPGRVLFHDLVPDESLAELYMRSHVQIIPQAEGTGAGAFPSKLPNLLAAGVPVFAICDSDSELALAIKESGCGLATDSRDLQHLARTLADFIGTVAGPESHPQRRESLSRYVEEKFSLNLLVGALTVF